MSYEEDLCNRERIAINREIKYLKFETRLGGRMKENYVFRSWIFNVSDK